MSFVRGAARGEIRDPREEVVRCTRKRTGRPTTRDDALYCEWNGFSPWARSDIDTFDYKTMSRGFLGEGHMRVNQCPTKHLQCEDSQHHHLRQDFS